MTTPAQSLIPFTAHYDCQRKNYWIQDTDKNWIEINETSLKRHLRARGVPSEIPKDKLVSEVDEFLNTTQMDNSVVFAGALAGYPKGVHDFGGGKILVTTQAVLPLPKAGEFPILKEVIYNLLHDELHDQQSYFLGWLKTGYEALAKWSRRPGQVLALAGPKQCGKSLLQNLITEILGGRSAKPYRYMSGMTQFNGELFGAEHLMIEDEPGSTDLRVRREFGSKIKDFTVNQVQSCHGKNRQALSLSPFWRMSISLNDEDENLMVLPPIDESLSDKIILLKTRTAQMPMPSETIEERDQFWNRLVSELPAFIHHLIQWKIPEALRCQRFAIRNFLHPELLEAIDGMSPEYRFLSLIDQMMFSDTQLDSSYYEITAQELERKLVQNQDTSFEARRLFGWSNACGTYLGRIATKQPNRIESQRTKTIRKWIIYPPNHIKSTPEIITKNTASNGHQNGGDIPPDFD